MLLPKAVVNRAVQCVVVQHNGLKDKQTEKALATAFKLGVEYALTGTVPSKKVPALFKPKKP